MVKSRSSGSFGVSLVQHRPGTIERAYQLARSGEFKTVAEIRTKLNQEGYLDVAGQIYGPTLASALRRLCLESTPPEPVAP